ncbi:hypothetical protein SDC9_208588 [bioreactor metagenome]|uniref:Uncharacterized protein n=1 Tax=bioreactor metagenome TaxID=1076179 RepID=A0A645JB02_9ZZZZ
MKSVGLHFLGHVDHFRIKDGSDQLQIGLFSVFEEEVEHQLKITLEFVPHRKRSIGEQALDGTQ